MTPQNTAPMEDVGNRRPRPWLLIAATAALMGMSSTEIGVADGIPALVPEIVAHVERVAREAGGPGKASVHISSLIRGDLDGDGREDAFLSFSVQGPGGGNLALLFQALFLNRGGDLALAAERSNGSAGTATGRSFAPEAIAPGRVVGRMLEYADGDGACCPSIERPAALVFDNGELVEREVESWNAMPVEQELEILSIVTDLHSLFNHDGSLEFRVLQSDASATVAYNPVRLFLVLTNNRPGAEERTRVLRLPNVSAVTGVDIAPDANVLRIDVTFDHRPDEVTVISGALTGAITVSAEPAWTHADDIRIEVYR